MEQLPNSPLNNAVIPQKKESTRKPNSTILVFLSIAVMLLSASLGAFLVNSYSSQTLIKTIVISGSAKQSFETEGVEIILVYLVRGADKNALKSSASTDFSVILNQLNKLSVDSIEKNADQVLPLVNGVFEYRVGAKVRIVGQDKIANVLSFLSSTDVVIAQTTYLPKDSYLAQAQLFQFALEDAKVKAQALSEIQGQVLGEIISITEVNSTIELGNSALNIQSGGLTTAELQKALSVTFEVK